MRQLQALYRVAVRLAELCAHRCKLPILNLHAAQSFVLSRGSLKSPLLLLSLSTHCRHLPQQLLISLLLLPKKIFSLLQILSNLLVALALGAAATFRRSADVFVIGLLDLEEETAEVLIPLDDLIKGVSERLHLLALVIRGLPQASSERAL